MSVARQRAAAGEAVLGWVGIAVKLTRVASIYQDGTPGLDYGCLDGGNVFRNIDVTLDIDLGWGYRVGLFFPIPSIKGHPHHLLTFLSVSLYYVGVMYPIRVYRFIQKIGGQL